MMQEFVQGVKDTARKTVEGIHTAVPAVIESYDPESGKAVVQPKAKYKKPDGKTIDYPSISGVPVVFPQSKNVTIAFPIKPGDGCLLIFSETAIDYWLYGKETATDLKFDLSSAIAIPNIAVTGDETMVEACSDDAVVIIAGNTKMKVYPGGVDIIGRVNIVGNVNITGNVDTTGNHNINGNINGGGNISNTGAITATGEVTGNGVALSTHTHTTGDGATSAPN